MALEAAIAAAVTASSTPIAAATVTARLTRSGRVVTLKDLMPSGADARIFPATNDAAAAAGRQVPARAPNRARDGGKPNR